MPLKIGTRVEISDGIRIYGDDCKLLNMLVEIGEGEIVAGYTCSVNEFEYLVAYDLEHTADVKKLIRYGGVDQIMKFIVATMSHRGFENDERMCLLVSESMLKAI